MPTTLDTSQFDLPEGALISNVASRNAPDPRSALVVQLRYRIEKIRAEQKEWAGRFDRLYDKAWGSDWDEAFLVQWAAALLEKQRAALELFHPTIEELGRSTADYGAQPDPELLELSRTTIDLVLGWVTPYQTLCGKLLELAAERQPAVGEVLRARSVAGETDYAELSREHMARYPKIRAALAD
jgi:hypothetical protein